VMPPRVAVLLAGFSGQKYIIDQVFSLLNQRSVHVDVFIRVDGDCPVFTEIVHDLCARFVNVHFIKGDSVSSPSSNFYNLILGADNSGFDFYALCDQDDIWHPDKLARSVSFFSDLTVEGYSSGFTTFQSTGAKRKYSLGAQSEFDYLFQSAGPGCTFVMRSSGFSLLQGVLTNHKELQRVLAHDWLIYFLFRLHNLKWVIDDASHIFYRQHGENVAGVNRGIRAKLHRAKLLVDGWYVSDLRRLFAFAKGRAELPGRSDVFNLRRSKVQSLLIWIYCWLYFRASLK
jgi:rhamnosyltransferase